ncbi:hypothetical protein M9H77_06597 [Catharanthus roseus]|uniref:Uncharacterized protein n=1 Tax=Catharanthus roseus TaxID=4058 RepID=A0ACC0BST3_CATRO|nr:hypothetical protein M9H77_06597 [Catharanthus roseus]
MLGWSTEFVAGGGIRVADIILVLDERAISINDISHLDRTIRNFLLFMFFVWYFGIQNEVVDENDEKLTSVRKEFGNDDEVYKAITRASNELNEYNPSGRYPML